MAGLTREGFTVYTYKELVDRISARLEAFSPGFDLSAETVDGQFVRIMSYEFSLAWNAAKDTHYSYNPMVADGDGLKNLGLISGQQYGVATRSQADVQLVGTAGTKVIKGSLVTDDVGNEFATQFDAVIPATVKVVAKLSGAILMPSSTITTIKSTTTGWTSVTQTAAGTSGSEAQTESSFRNIRNETVLRNFKSAPSVLEARLLALGLKQVSILNNDTTSADADGTPAGAIHVTVGETGTVTDLDIATTIYLAKGNGTPTYGSTNINVTDSQGTVHVINFDKATAVALDVNIDLTFLSTDIAGAEEAIQKEVSDAVNALLAGEDIVWSRLFGLVTPYGKAQINSLTIGLQGGTPTPVAANYAITATQYATLALADVNITLS